MIDYRQRVMAGKKRPNVKIVGKTKKRPRREPDQQTIINRQLWIPEELISQILSKLPDISLMRFKLVSKSWASMISDPSLINNSHKLILFSPRSVQLMEFEGYEGKAKKLDFCPITVTPRESYNVIGSSNGFLCIAVGNEISSDIFIWNPTTGEYNRTTVHPRQYDSLGFGYDHSIDDYKIVRFSYQSKMTMTGSVIHCVRKTSRKYIYKISGVGLGRSCVGTLVNYSLYWYANYERQLHTFCDICSDDKCTENCHNVIFKFDLVDQTQMLLKLPPIKEGKPDREQFIDFRGCLCVFQNYYGKCVDMWVLKGGKGTEHWKKLMTIQYLWDLPFLGAIEPIYFTRNGDVLVIIGKKRPAIIRANKLYSYNPIEKTFKRVKVDGYQYWDSHIAYN
ncbi:F-box protein [Quillaja saponaria]|uniref:F-box protein n=1 Tax=Quillaja saponaria TaxID=32244 RepID=A0AAD7KY44_QUISA|nr:F-box protein [Quillaja saponaria]